MSVKEDIQHYWDFKEFLEKECPGQVAVIKDAFIIDVFPTEMAAMIEMRKRGYKLDSYITRRILKPGEETSYKTVYGTHWYPTQKACCCRGCCHNHTGFNGLCA